MSRNEILAACGDPITFSCGRNRRRPAFYSFYTERWKREGERASVRRHPPVPLLHAYRLSAKFAHRGLAFFCGDYLILRVSLSNSNESRFVTAAKIDLSEVLEAIAA